VIGTKSVITHYSSLVLIVMELLGPTLVLYLIVGIGVAVAVYVSEKHDRSAGVWFRMATALPFWPLYIPILLSSRFSGEKENEKAQPLVVPVDEMSAAISQVDAELEAALSSLDGWAEDVLAREKGRIRELREAWTAQAQRVREMDRLLALPQYSVSDPFPIGSPVSGREMARLQSREVGTQITTTPQPHHLTTTTDRLLQSREACRQNIERLRQVRHRAYEDLMGTLAWVRELVSMIHLAKFTGAPASRAEELVAQIAAAVEGLSEVTWQEDPSGSVAGNTSIRG
jgi:hypothetical protein